VSLDIRFIIDECVGSSVAKWLSNKSYKIYSIANESYGISDEKILDKAFNEDWVIITNDKDFGDLIFRDKKKHCGVIFMRLDNESSINKIRCLEKLLSYHIKKIKNKFIVLTEKNIRIAKQNY